MDKKKSLSKPGIPAKVPRVAVKKTAGSSKKSTTKTATKPSAAKAASESGKLTKTSGGKKTSAEKIPAKTKAKTTGSKTELKKTPWEKPAKSADAGKAVAPEKRQVKKSLGKIAVSETRPATGKTVGVKKPQKAAAEKPVIDISTKTGVKTTRGVRIDAKAEATPNKEQTIIEKELQAVPKKKSVRKGAPAKTKKATGERLISKEKAKTFSAAARKVLKKKMKAPAFKGPKKTKEILEKTAAAYAVTPRKKIKPKRLFDLRFFLPEEELPEEAQILLPPPELPEEYGENELLLMEVDPSRVFASWEIKPDDIAGEAGKLVLRVYDVTGIDFEKVQSSSFFDIPIRQRVDSKFFDIKMPGRDVIMEIGLLYPEGSFKTIKRSHRVSMPPLQIFEELEITGLLSDSETLIGY
jgi:hypothetical protein